MADHRGLGPRLMRNTIGGAVGNILEWYDVAVFGYFVPMIGSQFFPSEDKLASMISAWLIEKTNHDVTTPAYYLMAMALVSFTAALFVPSKRGLVLQ